MTSRASSVVVLTRGDRPDDVDRLDRSLAMVSDVEFLLIGNGAPVDAPRRWRLISSSENLGVPGGRDFGARHATGAVIVFIDDDAVVRDAPAAMKLVAERFESEPDLAVIGFKVVKTGTDDMQQRWSPFLGRRNPHEETDATSYVGGGHAIRKTAYDEVGGYFGPLFYGLEETDLSWRLIDAGWRVSFDPRIVIEHPDTEPARHGEVQQWSSRNRMLVSRRNLPLPLAILYVLDWAVIDLVRSPSKETMKSILTGLAEGIRADRGRRRPVSWRTAWRLTRLGRPPVI